VVVPLHEVVSDLLFFDAKAFPLILGLPLSLGHISASQDFGPLLFLFTPNLLISQNAFKFPRLPHLITKLTLDILLIIIVFIFERHILIAVIAIHNNFLFFLVQTLDYHIVYVLDTFSV
jgi:hypothetical protein